MLEPRFAWHLPAPIEIDPALIAAGAAQGISGRLVWILAGRGIDTPAALGAYLGPAAAGLFEPGLLPDADRLLERLNQLRADDGSVQDWQLSLRKLLAHREDHVHDVWSSFATWRRTYVAERVVADVATVRSFLAWADKVADVTALHALNLPKVSIEAKIAPKVAWQVHEEKVCRLRSTLRCARLAPFATW